MQLPLALLGTLLTSPMGPGAAVSGAKMIGRNLPLVVLIAVFALLFWPADETKAEGEDAPQPGDQPVPEPAPAANGDWRAAAENRHAA